MLPILPGLGPLDMYGLTLLRIPSYWECSAYILLDCDRSVYVLLPKANRTDPTRNDAVSIVVCYDHVNVSDVFHSSGELRACPGNPGKQFLDVQENQCFLSYLRTTART